MQPTALPSIEISVALLSWVNAQLRTAVLEQEERRILHTAAWIQNGITVVSVMLSGLCVMVLQRWS